jgi:hypothetical protein
MSSFIDTSFSKYQDFLYTQLNRISRDDVVGGRILALPCSLIDTVFQTAKGPLVAIEYTAYAALNTLGFLFSEEYTVKKAITYLDNALREVVTIPVTVAMAPVNFVYQFFTSVRDPENACSMKDLLRYPKPTFVDINKKFTEKQTGWYDSFRPFAASHPLLGRVIAIPLAVADVALQTLKTPLTAIDAAASALINLLGMLFFKSCTFEQALYGINTALIGTAQTIVSLAICPIKLAYQVLANLYNPAEARSNCNRYV